MNMEENRYTSGLVFMASRNCDTLELSASMQRVLEANGHRICGVQVLSDNHVQVTSDILTLELSVPEAKPQSAGETPTADTHSCKAVLDHAALIIELSLTHPTEPGVIPAKRNTQATLASLTCQMAIWLEPDYVRWLNEDALLDTKDFVKAVARVMPRRVKRKKPTHEQRSTRPVLVQSPPDMQPVADMVPEMPVRPSHPTLDPDRPQTARTVARFPDVDATSRKLEGEYDRRNRLVIEQSDLHELSELRTSFSNEDDDALEATGIASPRNSVARMATWFLAITVGIFSLPVAAFLMVYNLFRGEDFRLSAQALSLTGLFTALSARGATADVMQFVTQIVG
ncbi:MAG: hypothetical protein ACRBBS_06830 [Thalassovita sp.]